MQLGTISVQLELLMEDNKSVTGSLHVSNSYQLSHLTKGSQVIFKNFLISLYAKAIN